MFWTKVVEKIKTYFMVKNVFRKLCRVWDNLKKCGKARQTPYNRTRKCMHFAWWITMPRTHTHTIMTLNTQCFLTTTIFTPTLLSVTLHVHCLPSSFFIIYLRSGKVFLFLFLLLILYAGSYKAQWKVMGKEWGKQIRCENLYKSDYF
jgi:hypothetical protein